VIPLVYKGATTDLVIIRAGERANCPDLTPFIDGCEAA
jgi:hypothetical protein